MIEQILAALPQTQCEQCGYKGCKPYATAIANDRAHTNLCAPGGQKVADRLAAITNTTPMRAAEPSNSIALIDENLCIGCTKCIKVCPTDAIVGANKLMHTVIADDCTGCGLCEPVCPMECISFTLIEPFDLDNSEHVANAARFRQLHAAKKARETIQITVEETNHAKSIKTKNERQNEIKDAIARKRATRLQQTANKDI